MQEERTRIVDIAQELGLSTATVSNVIHGKTKKVSAETVRRVQELVEKKKYIPSMAGILLAQNNSRIVGIVVNNHEKYENHVLEDTFIAGSMNALSMELERAGYFMMVKVTADLNEIVRFASMWNMEGLVLLGFCGQDYEHLREAMHIPFVVYDGYGVDSGFLGTPRVCNLVIDDYDGGRQVGAYLKEIGHKKLLCIADNCICMDQERIEGCREGFAPGEPDFWLLPFSREERRRFYEERLERLREYTAVFAVSDFYAAELMHFLQEKGIRIPEEISLVGFDGSPLCEQVYPHLTSVEQDSALRAKQAVAKLRELKDRTCSENVVCLPVFLIRRESVRRL